jgi:iron complex outermembrane receptor protein
MKLLFPNRLFTLTPLNKAILMALVACNASPVVMAESKNQPDKVRNLETVQVTDTSERPAPASLKNDPVFKAAKVEASQSPGGVTLVEIDDMRNRNVSSIADFFRYVPGTWAASQSGNDETFISMRGSNLDSTNFDGSGTKLLQDGLPVTAADGNNHNRVIDPLASQYATVARGANAMKYGASTLGGAIDFTSPTAHNSPMATLSLSGASFGEFLGRGTVSKVFNDKFDALLTVEGKVWDGYRDHNQQDRVGVYGNFGVQVTDSIVNRTFLSYIKNNQEFAGQLTREQFEANPKQASQQALDGNYQLNVETERVANKTTWTIDDRSSLDIGVSFENQDLYHPIVAPIMVDFDGPGPLQPQEVFSLLVNTQQQDWGTSARYNLHLDDHDLLLGMNFGINSEKGGNYRNAHGTPNGMTNQLRKDASTVEVFAQDHWHINERWTLTPALQGVFAHREVNSIGVNPVTGALTGQNSHPNDNYQGINPSLGLAYRFLKDANAYMNVSRLYEPPTNYNLSDNTITNRGDATLKAMEGTSLEIGTRGTHEFNVLNRMNWDISLYYSWLNKEILSVSPVPGVSLAKNFNNTTHAGIESLIGGQFALDGLGTHSIAPLINFTFNHFVFDNDPLFGNNRLPSAPSYFLKGELLYRHASGVFVGPTVDVVGRRFADYSNNYKVPGYALLGARAGWSNEHYKVFFEARNLLDKNYVASNNVVESGTANAQLLNPGAPISFFGGVEVNF